MKRKCRRLAPLKAMAFCLLAAGCRRAALPSFAPPVALVNVVQAVSRDVPVYLDEIGQGTAFKAITVMPQVSGMLLEQNFEDGADVKKGQLLLTIDPRPFQAQLDSAQAQVVQSQASLDLAKVQFEMYAAVADTRAISKFDYNTRKSAVETGAAQLKAAEAAVETAKLNLEYCSIRSPVDGRAGKALVNAGNVVTANQTAILTIQQLAPLYVDFTITERDLPRVKELMAQGALKAFVWLPSEAEDAARDGEMNFLDNAVQNSTGTVGLRATLPNTDRHFWPGQFVRVRLVLETKKNAVLVPNRAPQISQKGPYVFVVKADGTAELRQVTLGQWQGDLVVIEQGLAAGESVVTTGQLAVNPGAKVQVEAPGAESPSPAGTGEKAAGKEAPSPAGTGAKAAGSAEPN
ncbi:MAG: efflux RND transporter periplasmic adaptor subunit [Candidatus Brocadiia bacterium]